MGLSLQPPGSNDVFCVNIDETGKVQAGLTNALCRREHRKFLAKGNCGATPDTIL